MARTNNGARKRGYEKKPRELTQPHKAHDTRPTDPAVWEEIERRWKAGESITQISRAMSRTRGQVGGLIARKLGSGSRAETVKIHALASKLAGGKSLAPPPPPALPKPTLEGEERFLIDLGRGRHCHYPTDKGRGADTAYCGAKTPPGHEYCDHHARVMVRAPPVGSGGQTKDRTTEQKSTFARGVVRAKMADAFFRGVI